MVYTMNFQKLYSSHAWLTTQNQQTIFQKQWSVSTLLIKGVSQSFGDTSWQKKRIQNLSWENCCKKEMSYGLKCRHRGYKEDFSFHCLRISTSKKVWVLIKGIVCSWLANCGTQTIFFCMALLDLHQILLMEDSRLNHHKDATSFFREYGDGNIISERYSHTCTLLTSSPIHESKEAERVHKEIAYATAVQMQILPCCLVQTWACRVHSWNFQSICYPDCCNTLEYACKFGKQNSMDRQTDCAGSCVWMFVKALVCQIYHSAWGYAGSSKGDISYGFSDKR